MQKHSCELKQKFKRFKNNEKLKTLKVYIRFILIKIK